jgi:hypothetical protein
MIAATAAVGETRNARLRPYVAMVLAAQEHDGGLVDWEIRPTLDAQGHPPDYVGSVRTLGEDTWLDFNRHGIRRVAEQDPYAGYIVSMHSEGLLTRGMGLLPYMPDYTVFPNVQAFIREQKAYRTQLIAEMRNSPEYESEISEARLWTNFSISVRPVCPPVCNRYPFDSKDEGTAPPTS